MRAKKFLLTPLAVLVAASMVACGGSGSGGGDAFTGGQGGSDNATGATGAYFGTIDNGIFPDKNVNINGIDFGTLVLNNFNHIVLNGESWTELRYKDGDDDQITYGVLYSKGSGKGGALSIKSRLSTNGANLTANYSSDTFKGSMEFNGMMGGRPKTTWAFDGEKLAEAKGTSEEDEGLLVAAVFKDVTYELVEEISGKNFQVNLKSDGSFSTPENATDCKITGTFKKQAQKGILRVNMEFAGKGCPKEGAFNGAGTASFYDVDEQSYYAIVTKTGKEKEAGGDEGMVFSFNLP